MGFKITASGLNARIPPAVPALVAGETGGNAVDAHAIQPFYTGLLARDLRHGRYARAGGRSDRADRALSASAGEFAARRASAIACEYSGILVLNARNAVIFPLLDALAQPILNALATH